MQYTGQLKSLAASAKTAPSLQKSHLTDGHTQASR